MRQLSEPGAAFPDNALLQAHGIVAGYLPGVNILNGCDLYAAKGELIGILGPNGAGKSTLLKAMFSLVKVRQGRFALRDVDITNSRADKLVRMGVGFVPQTENVFPRLSIMDNLRMGAFQDRARFDERFNFVANVFPILADRRHQKAGQLSGGERQMVAMARALMMNPAVLLLDEPSAGLSPSLTDEAFVHVQDINNAGVTIVMVEQNANRCLEICDRAYVLEQGRNAYTGTGPELANDPKVIELYLGSLAGKHRNAT